MKRILLSFSQQLHIFLFREIKSNEEMTFFLFVIKLFQHLPPYSSEKHSLFKPSYKSSARFMNQERANGLKKFETQHSVNDIEK